jgi:c-di-GMP-binding flagellar brake protein YcgR
VQPDGLAKGEQKRRHVRATTDALATIVRDQALHSARLLDVSEGGLRCRLEDAGAVVGVGDVISCGFKAGTKDLDLRARVLQVHVDVDEPRVLAVQFVDLTGHQSDELRRHVFAEQARARARTVR